MGLLEQAMSALGGGGGGGQVHPQHQGLMAGLMKLVQSPQMGGIGGLLSRLHAGGLGGAVQSWIGTGANQPVTGQQLAGALGQEHIDQVAREAGMSPADASGQLAGLLPGLIDKMTPGGQLPAEASHGGGGGLMDLLKGQLGGGMRQ